jgi:hypothetical protein
MDRVAKTISYNIITPTPPRITARSILLESNQSIIALPFRPCLHYYIVLTQFVVIGSCCVVLGRCQQVIDGSLVRHKE